MLPADRANRLSGCLPFGGVPAGRERTGLHSRWRPGGTCSTTTHRADFSGPPNAANGLLERHFGFQLGLEHARPR